MKRILFFLFAVVFSILISCKKEAAPAITNPIAPTKSCKITGIGYLLGPNIGGGSDQFSYDSNDRLIQTIQNRSNNSPNISHTYNGNKIISKLYSTYQVTTDIYTLNNLGFPIKSESFNIKSPKDTSVVLYTYNNENQLIKAEELGEKSKTTTYEWSGGNMIKSTQNGSDTVFEYDEKILAKSFPYPSPVTFGVGNKNLPKADATYTFNENGYISNIKYTNGLEYKITYLCK